MAVSGLFDQQVAVVTGAGDGIGAGVALALAHHGARVVVVDVDGAGARRTAAKIVTLGGPEPLTLSADVTHDGIPARIAAVAARAGGATLLVNNVGDHRPSTTFQNDDARNWQRMYARNFEHVLTVTHALLPQMVERQRGAILNISSVEGLRGIPGNAVYGAFKAAVIAFTASLAAEVGRLGIRVNCLAPDLTDTAQTPMWASIDERYADHVGRWVPVGRFGAPRDHGDAAVFLLSEQSSFITGECLRVDGGTLAAPGWFRRDEHRFTNLPRPLT